MSINKRYIQDLTELQDKLEKNGPKWFYKTYVMVPDVLIGPSDSMQFISDFAELYESEDVIKKV